MQRKTKKEELITQIKKAEQNLRNFVNVFGAQDWAQERIWKDEERIKELNKELSEIED